MRIGTRSILFGIHNFVVHPIIVAIAWTKLYGFPFQFPLWAAFVLHDLGYLGKRDMDSREGEKHVEPGSRIMAGLFGKKWGDFCKYHSRFYSKKEGRPPSRLCFADKLAIVTYPKNLYLFLGNLSGEINEYVERSKNGKYKGMHLDVSDVDKWYNEMCTYVVRWIGEHKDGKEDHWTPK